MTLDTKRKEKPDMKIEYVYVKPKTEEEAREAERRLIAAYDVLFDATLKKMEDEGYAPELLDKFRL